MASPNLVRNVIAFANQLAKDIGAVSTEDVISYLLGLGVDRIVCHYRNDDTDDGLSFRLEKEGIEFVPEFNSKKEKHYFPFLMNQVIGDLLAKVGISNMVETFESRILFDIGRMEWEGYLLINESKERIITVPEDKIRQFPKLDWVIKTIHKNLKKVCGNKLPRGFKWDSWQLEFPNFGVYILYVLEASHQTKISYSFYEVMNNDSPFTEEVRDWIRFYIKIVDIPIGHGHIDSSSIRYFFNVDKDWNISAEVHYRFFTRRIKELGGKLKI